MEDFGYLNHGDNFDNIMMKFVS